MRCLESGTKDAAQLHAAAASHSFLDWLRQLCPQEALNPKPLTLNPPEEGPNLARMTSQALCHWRRSKFLGRRLVRVLGLRV